MLILEKLNELVALLDEKVTMDVLNERVYFSSAALKMSFNKTLIIMFGDFES